MESKPIGKTWLPHRHIELWQLRGPVKVVTHVQIPARIGVCVGQKYEHAGETWTVGRRYETPWNKCMDL